MKLMLVVAFVLAVAAMIGLRLSVIVVPHDAAYVVERLGAYRQTLTEGLHVLTPFVDRIAFRYTLRRTEDELSDRCITEDNVPVNVTSSYTWRIVDPRLFAYSTANGAEFVSNLIRSHQRKWIGERPLNTARETKRELEVLLPTSVSEPAREGGAEVLSVTIYAIANTGQEQ